jgi:signal transduction histidine kinase
MGLGLYQCRSLVRAHGGTLQVESRPGEGTRFRLGLGVVDAVSAAEAAPLMAAEGVLT